MLNNKISINISLFFKLIVISNKVNLSIFLLNDYFLLKINLNKKLNIFIDNENNNIIIFYNKKIKINKIMIKNKLENFLKLKNLFLFIKIKFKGKGYKINIFKKKKIINFFFNHSHKTILKLKKINVIKINKNKFILLNKNKCVLNITGKKLTNIRKINIFTLRGLRVSKKIIFKRKGKKSSYI